MTLCSEIGGLSFLCCLLLTFVFIDFLRVLFVLCIFGLLSADSEQQRGN